MVLPLPPQRDLTDNAMILRMPLYYKKFRCIADKCKDNCCIGWEIDIDEKTACLYKGAGGNFGERLRKNIAIDEGCRFILGENERCPFLNGRNLCDIILNMGEDSLCYICREHPRYYEWYGDIKEGGIGLACEEASRLILGEKEPFAYYETETDEAGDCYPDYELFCLLEKAREAIISHLSDESIKIKERLRDIVVYGKRLQDNLDNDEYKLPEIERSKPFKNENIDDIFGFMATLEPINEEWKSYFDEKKSLSEKIPKGYVFDNAVSRYLSNIAVYFIWRYFMKGVFEGEILSAVILSAVSTAFIGRLIECEAYEGKELTLELCSETARLFSKELEYSEENVNALLDSAYNEFYPE